MVDIMVGQQPLATARSGLLQGFVDNIEKSDFDERNYRILELQNGLKAVLVNDPLADKSAACLRVAVGSLYDPVRVFASLISNTWK